MYPYGNHSVPQVPYEYNHFPQQELYDPNRQLSQLHQLPQWQQLERRVTQLERQNDRQEREIVQLQRRLQRLNQRVRLLEQRLNIPFTTSDGEF